MAMRCYEHRPVTSWGRIKRLQATVLRPHFRDEIQLDPNGTQLPTLLGIGAGRSYGDSALNEAGAHVDMTGIDRLMAFDRDSGLLRAEAGLTLDELLRITVPSGWFLPTTPGTRFVTLGGAVANDVHGKNHHSAGTFGSSVTRLGLYRSAERDLEVAPHTHPDLFAATIGGLGLTGLITWVELRLHRIGSSLLSAETIPFRGYDEFLALSQSSTPSWEHTVAWIDCTSGRSAKGARGLFSRANWLAAGPLDAHATKSLVSVPFDAPSGLINSWTLKAFNTLYYTVGRRKRSVRLVPYGSFFYPLDTIRNWNRAYGRNGFYQYQCVVPLASARDAIGDMLEDIAWSGEGSCLAVLKTFGNRPSPGFLSFPMEGVTLALDFPNRSRRTQALFSRLDHIVRDAGGRLYPAKDGRMPAAMFRAGYPRLAEFEQQIDPKFESDFWRRMRK